MSPDSHAMDNDTYAEVGAKIARLAGRCDGPVEIFINSHERSGWTPGEEIEMRGLHVPLVAQAEMDARNTIVIVELEHSCHLHQVAHWDLATALDLAWEAIP